MFFLVCVESCEIHCWAYGNKCDYMDSRRSFGLEMKSLLICMRRGLVMLVILVLSLEGLTTVATVSIFTLTII